MNQPCFICGRETCVPFEAEKQNPEAGKHALCKWCYEEKEYLDNAAIDELLNHNAKQTKINSNQ